MSFWALLKINEISDYIQCLLNVRGNTGDLGWTDRVRKQEDKRDNPSIWVSLVLEGPTYILKHPVQKLKLKEKNKSHQLIERLHTMITVGIGEHTASQRKPRASKQWCLMLLLLLWVGQFCSPKEPSFHPFLSRTNSHYVHTVLSTIPPLSTPMHDSLPPSPPRPFLTHCLSSSINHFQHIAVQLKFY